MSRETNVPVEFRPSPAVLPYDQATKYWRSPLDTDSRRGKPPGADSGRNGSPAQFVAPVFVGETIHAGGERRGDKAKYHVWIKAAGDRLVVRGTLSFADPAAPTAADKAG